MSVAPPSYDELVQQLATLKQRNQELEIFSAAFHAATDTMALSDLNGRFVEVNAALCEGLGYSREELLKMQGIDLKPTSLHEKFKNALTSLKEEGSLTLETVYQRKDTTTFPVELSATVVQHGTERLIQIIARDITQRKRREDVLYRFKEIFSRSQDLIDSIDDKYTYRMINQQFCKDYNREPEQIIGHSVAHILGKEVFTKTIKPQIDRSLNGEVVHYQGWFEHETIGRRFRDVSYYPDKSADGSINGIFTITQDLTDFKEVQKAKKAEQALLSHVLANINGDVYLITKSHEILYANTHLKKNRGPLNGQKCYEYISDRKTPCPWCKNPTIFSSEKPICWVHNSFKNNRLYTVFETMVKDSNFAPVKVTFFHDITTSKNREQEFRHKTQLLEEIVNNSSTIIHVKDKEGKYLFGNRQFEKLFARASDTIYGKTDFNLFPEQHATLFREHDKIVLASGKVVIFEEELPYEDKEHSYISIKFPLFDDQDTPYAVGSITTDITERKKMEQELRDQNERMLSLINASPDIICFKDGESRWLLANDANLSLFELEKVDYVGKTDIELAEYSTFYREAFLTCQNTDEFAWQEKTLSHGTKLIPQPDGHTRIYDIIKVPLFHQDGTRKGLVIIGRNITDYVNASKKLEEKNKKIRDTNIALQVLVDQRQDICHTQEQQIQFTLKRLVFPYLENLAQIEMEENGQEYVQLISTHLQLLADSFCRKLDAPSIGLSPKELLVADLVRQGKKSPAIARLLGLTVRTIEVYRTSVRKKLKISGKKINLHRYLQEKFPM